MTNRLKFLQSSAAIAGGGLLVAAANTKAFSIFKNSIMPGNQVNVGAIGINGMGWADVTAALKIPGVNLVAVCDVDKNVINKRLADLSKLGVDRQK